MPCANSIHHHTVHDRTAGPNTATRKKAPERERGLTVSWSASAYVAGAESRSGTRTMSAGPSLVSVLVMCPVLQNEPAIAVRAFRPPGLRRNLQPDPGMSPFTAITGNSVFGDFLDFRNLGYHAQSSVQAPGRNTSFVTWIRQRHVPVPIRSRVCSSGGTLNADRGFAATGFQERGAQASVTRPAGCIILHLRRIITQKTTNARSAPARMKNCPSISETCDN